jgi:RNA polymerase sigma-70 factor (ECF subfamily)
MTQDAFAEAVRRWPADGVPPNPAGWLTVTARNRALDRLRRESTRDARHQEAEMLNAPDDFDQTSSIPDERLRLLFTCCHPAIAPTAQVALTLRLLGGLTVPEVAAAFLVPERTMAQRITRGKRKIAAAKIPYRVPRDAELPERLGGVLATIYLVYNEGYLPRSGDSAVRTDLSGEAIRLARTVHTLMPDEPEVTGLLALLLLSDARRGARVVGDELVPLDEQDRSRWDAEMIAEGHALVRECLRRNRPGHYQLLAAINAVHADAATYAETDWSQIVALYDMLHAVTPTPVVALNRAVAVAELDGPQAGLELVDDLDLADYQPFHVTRADLLRRLGRAEESAAAYDRAIAMTDNAAEREFLSGRRALLG